MRGFLSVWRDFEGCRQSRPDRSEKPDPRERLRGQSPEGTKPARFLEYPETFSPRGTGRRICFADVPILTVATEVCRLTGIRGCGAGAPAFARYSAARVKGVAPPKPAVYVQSHSGSDLGVHR